MILYHLDKWKYKDVWPPEGTLHAEGRWNKARQWVIYTSPNISLAKLEILANENNLPINRVCMKIEVQEGVDIFELTSDKLPFDWMDKPYPSELVKFTSEFLNSNCLLMTVPSAQSYNEYNYLINVRHKDFHEKVKLIGVYEEPFDTRLK